MRETFTDPPDWLPEHLQLYDAFIARGLNTPFELRQLARRSVRERLTAPDLEARRSFRDGMALWRAVQFGVRAPEIRALSADAVRRLARVLDDAALRERFLAVSPVGRVPRSMNGDEIREEELDQTAREVLFWVLSDRWMMSEVDALRRAARAEDRCPPFSGTTPEVNRMTLPAEGVDAWKEAARFHAWAGTDPPRIGAEQPAGKKRERSDVGAPNLEAALDAFFREPATFQREDIARFYWTSGFWCGTGGEGFRAVQERIALMLDLRDRRIPAAVARMLGEELQSQLFPADFRGPDDWRTPLLELCGLDWEKLFSSALLPFRDAKDPGRIRSRFAEELLAARGSTVAARILLAVDHKGFKPIETIARFITPGDADPSDAPQVQREVQQGLVELLAADLRPDKEYISLANSLGLLVRLHRPEIKEAIRPLLAHRYSYVRQQAHSAMLTMGEDPGPLIHAAHVRFRIVLNGEAFKIDANSDLFPVIEYETAAEGWTPNGITPNYSYNAAGLLEFDHEPLAFAAERKLTNARLVVRPAPASFASLGKKMSLDQPWFSAPIPLPIRFDEVNEARASTVPLQVRVIHPRGSSARPEDIAELELTWLDEPEPRKLGPSKFREPLRETYKFTALQAGRYRLGIVASGAVPYASGVIEHKPDMPPLAVELAPASDIQAKIILPEFRPGDELPHVALVALDPWRWMARSVIAALYREGAQLADATQTFDSPSRVVTFPNVSPGKYKLRILSSQDLANKIGGRLETEAGEPANAGWSRAELDVTVKPNSPASIDAGEVRLKRVALRPSKRPK